MIIIEKILNTGNCINQSNGDISSIRECLTKPLDYNCAEALGANLALACPITSIFFGLGRLRSLFHVIQNESKDNPVTLSQKLYYFTTGIIAFLGLGIILFILRIFYSLFIVTPCWVIGSLVGCLSSQKNDPSSNVILQLHQFLLDN